MASPTLADRLDGLLFFPVTAFRQDGRINLEAFREHVAGRMESGPGAVFACCGTGEFFSLDPDEYGACVAAAVEVAGGRVPVIGGAGYGTALAAHFVRAAEQAGADGVLAMPPYLVDAGQAGLRRHYEALAGETDLDVILYQRDNAVFDPQTVAALAEVPNIIGLKDGFGDLDLMQRIISAVRRSGREDFRYFNGMPTAEMTGLAYRGIGVTLYSSAVFCYAPDLALAFHQALTTGDDPTAQRMIDEFFAPFVELRRRGKGYAVSLVKAATRAGGVDVGPVRPPLAEPDEEDVKQLLLLADRARRNLGLLGDEGEAQQ